MENIILYIRITCLFFPRVAEFIYNEGNNKRLSLMLKLYILYILIIAIIKIYNFSIRDTLLLFPSIIY